MRKAQKKEVGLRLLGLVAIVVGLGAGLADGDFGAGLVAFGLMVWIALHIYR